ncbi:MAG: glycosyltransferase family 2 protein [Chitinophagaceae bacterium]|nr:glycosyltransferase family 2 protein [Chitinophagaceae bacterium]
MSSPLVSVIIPVYNAEKYIEQTIRSVLDQTLQDFEIIALSDGSPDGSAAIIQRLQKEDSRIYFIDKKNTGVSDTRNKGIQQAKGKYIAFLDADDVWNPDNLEKKINKVKASGRRWVFSDHEYIDENNQWLSSPERPLREDAILERLLLWEKGDVVPGPCSNIVAEKKLFDEGVQFDVHLSSPADRDISIQLAAKAEPAIVHERLWKYRIHSKSMSNQNLKVADEVIVFIRKMRKSNLFSSKRIRRRSLSNLYYMLAGYYGSNGYRLKGTKYFIRSFLFSPGNIWNKKIRPAFATKTKK